MSQIPTTDAPRLCVKHAIELGLIRKGLPYEKVNPASCQYEDTPHYRYNKHRG